MPEDDEPRRPALDKQPRDDASVAGAPDDVAAAEAADDGPTGRDDEPTTRRRAPLWLETIVLLVVALGMALIIKTFFVQAFYIPSGSMEPGLVENDRILVQKPSYWFGREPQRGDVIVFEDPGGWLTGPETGPQTVLAKGLAKIGLYPTGGHLVKRVIGTPGDTIECCDDQGRLIINGVAVDEKSFVAEGLVCDGPMPFNQQGCERGWTVTVPDDRLFVMGDNRAASADSSDRFCNQPDPSRCDPDQPVLPRNNPDRPFVPMDNVVGKVFVLVWPLDHAEFIGRPDVFADVPDAP